jgi:hypothetical protein
MGTKLGPHFETIEESLNYRDFIYEKYSIDFFRLSGTFFKEDVKDIYSEWLEY